MLIKIRLQEGVGKEESAKETEIKLQKEEKRTLQKKKRHNCKKEKTPLQKTTTMIESSQNFQEWVGKKAEAMKERKKKS